MLDECLLKRADLFADAQMLASAQRLARQWREWLRVSVDAATQVADAREARDRAIAVAAPIIEPMAPPACPSPVNTVQPVAIAAASWAHEHARVAHRMRGELDPLAVDLNFSGLVDGEVVTPVSVSAPDCDLDADRQQPFTPELEHANPRVHLDQRGWRHEVVLGTLAESEDRDHGCERSRRMPRGVH